MKQRILAVMLLIAVLASCLAGCVGAQTGETDVQPEPGGEQQGGSPPRTSAQFKRMEADAVSSKYAYQAEYIDLPVKVDYIQAYSISGSSLWFMGNVSAGKETYVDEATGESYEYDNYENQLFRMDLTTQECVQIPLPEKTEVPEGWQGDAYTQEMCAGSDGTVWLYEQMNIYRFNLPEGLDTTVENQYDYYESGPSSSALIQLSADGEVLNRIDVAQEDENGGSLYLNYFIVDSNGYIYAGNWEKILVWDKDGNQIASLDNDDGGQLVQYSADKVGLLTNGETHGVKVFDPVKKDWGETIELPTFAYDIQPGDDVYDFFYDYNGKIYGYISETDTAEKVVDWMECDVDSNNMQAYKILPDGRVFAFTQKWTQDGTQTQFILLSRVDAATLPEKTTLTLACMYMDYNLRSQIVNFNRRNSQYRIVVKDYSEYNTEDDYNAGLTKLATEIASGAMPDILVTDQLPVSRYAAKGLLQDLWPFIDADTEISRDDLVTDVLDALSIDGRLYEIPASFSLSTVAGLEKVVGEYDTWTLADLRDAMTKLQPGATIFGEGVTKDNILENCVSASFDELIDWETGTCSFDGETFRELLEFANEFPAEFDYENSDMYDTYESDYSRMRSGKQLLTNQGFYGFDDLYVTFVAMENAPCFVGYPTTGTPRRSTFQTDTALAITAACIDNDAAWAFVRTTLQEEYQNEIWTLPINKSVFDAKLAEAMKQEFYTDENGNQVEQSKGGIGWGNDEMIEIYAVTPEQRDAFMELLHSTTSVNSYDESIMEIVREETGGYFAGQKTLDETVKIIQNRVSLYVAEQSN